MQVDEVETSSSSEQGLAVADSVSHAVLSPVGGVCEPLLLLLLLLLNVARGNRRAREMRRRDVVGRPLRRVNGYFDVVGQASRAVRPLLDHLCHTRNKCTTGAVPVCVCVCGFGASACLLRTRVTTDVVLHHSTKYALSQKHLECHGEKPLVREP